MTEQRRLAAIVSADVAGYSRLMGRDEGGRWRPCPLAGNKQTSIAQGELFCF
jgi:hypothetical protein